MKQSNRCVCELYGECKVCRPPIKHDLDAHLAEIRVQQCEWCKGVLCERFMYRLGKNKWNKWVCGADCLMRPRYGKIWKGRNMAASKKLYEMLAYDMVKIMPRLSFDDYEMLIKHVGKSLAQDNSNFDWVKWLRATGVAKGK